MADVFTMTISCRGYEIYIEIPGDRRRPIVVIQDEEMQIAEEMGFDVGPCADLETAIDSMRYNPDGYIRAIIMDRRPIRGGSEVWGLLLDEGIVGILISLGSGIPKVLEGDTFLSRAVELGKTRPVRDLIDAGLDIHEKDEQALRRASDKGYFDIVALLLEHGADLHAMGDQALVNAVREGHSGVAELLLEAGADPTATNFGGKRVSAIEIARRRVEIYNNYEARDLLQMLLSYADRMERP